MLLEIAPPPEPGLFVACPEIAYPAPRALTFSNVDEQGQVTVHCLFRPGPFDCIRIWPTTYLICRSSGHRRRLLHAEGIPFAPEWLPVPAGSSVSFLLIFEALPQGCSLFDLVEEIDDPGGFHVCGIPRNHQDVYRIQL